jgi:hypothetical protein
MWACAPVCVCVVRPLHDCGPAYQATAKPLHVCVWHAACACVCVYGTRRSRTVHLLAQLRLLGLAHLGEFRHLRGGGKAAGEEGRGVAL